MSLGLLKPPPMHHNPSRLAQNAFNVEMGQGFIYQGGTIHYQLVGVTRLGDHLLLLLVS